MKAPQSPDEVWTWEEFKAALQKVVDSGACRYGLVVDKTSYRFCSFLYSAGGSLMNAERTASAFNSDAARFGGSGVINGEVLASEDAPASRCPYRVRLTVPPLGIAVLKREKE